MQDGRNLARRTAVFHRYVQSGGDDLGRESQQNSSEEKKKSEIQIQMSKLVKISGLSWEITYIGSWWSKDETQWSEERFSDISELYRYSETHKNNP